MKISRITILTLGVSDLDKATEFYKIVLGTPPNTSADGITFIELPGTWISLHPLDKLAEDIFPEFRSHATDLAESRLHTTPAAGRMLLQ